MAAKFTVLGQSTDSVLFDRRCVIAVDDFQIEGVRVQFRVKKTLKKEPNTAEINVFNLAGTSRSRMQSRHAKVILQAGYVSDTQVIFAGDSRTIDQIHAAPEWITKIQCGDGEKAYQFDTIVIAFAAGTKRLDAIKKVASNMALGRGNLIPKVEEFLAKNSDKTTFTKGFQCVGTASVALTQLLAPLGLGWSVQNGEIQALGTENDKLAVAAVLLSPETGLIGSPEHGTPDKKGKPSVLKARCFLRPQIRPGSTVQIQSAGTNGLYRVEQVEHIGDTAGPEWYTQIEAKPL